jgi:iron complex transport system ATP-binding protein
VTAPVIQARDLKVRLGSQEVLRGVSLDLAPGDCAALLGLNGAGKTTLLRLLLGLIHPDAGEILLDGRPLNSQARREIARRMAYVPQAHVPSFPFSVREIVAMGRAPTAGWGSRPRAQDEAAVSGALDRLGMLAFAERSYAQLSGGERQAVLIARALAQGATILLMDEPTASLDLGQQTRLMALLSDLAAEGHAILVSVHQPELALRWFNRAILLHEGRVLSDGPPLGTVTGQSLSRLYGIDARLIEAEQTLFLLAAIARDRA